MTLTTIEFRGTRLAAIPGPTPDTTLVAVKPLVEGMGLDWNAQRQRLMRHPVLQTCACVMHVQVPGDTQARETVFLALTKVPFFLGTIQPARIGDRKAREAVIAFQREAADVLFAHFFGKAVAAVNNAAGVSLPAAPVGNLTVAEYFALPLDERRERRFTVMACNEVNGPLSGQWLWNQIMPRVPDLARTMDERPDLFRAETAGLTLALTVNGRQH